MKIIKVPKLSFLTLLLGLLLTGCATVVGSAPEDGDASVTETEDGNKIDREFRIVTLLPKDAIPSIDNPRFYTVEEADQEYDPDEIVLGVVFDGEARAYSVNMLSSHEIVNDVLAGVPIAVTW